MNLWTRLRCFFSPSNACVLWDADEDETIRYLRSEKRAAEEATAHIRRNRGGWFEGTLYPDPPPRRRSRDE